MNNLVEHLSTQTGLDVEKASNVLHTIADYIKEKYPLLEHTVDSILEIEAPRQSNFPVERLFLNNNSSSIADIQ